MMPRKIFSRDLGDQIKEWLEGLRRDSERKIVLVEHKPDKVELEGWGIKNVIYLEKPIERFVERLAAMRKDCISLIDIARHCRAEHEHIRTLLSDKGIKVDWGYRNFLIRLQLKELRGLRRFIDRHLLMTAGRRHDALLD